MPERPSLLTQPGWPQDLLASLVVFLVALPLCMGIAIASGAPPIYGLISGIIGGLVVGFVTGSPLQVSGPAAGLTVLVWDMIQSLGLESIGFIVLMAGIIQIAAGQMRMGQWFRAISPAVIQGMLSGIGVLIFASQFHVMLDSQPVGDGLENLLAIPGAVMRGLFPLEGTSHHLAAATGILTIVVIIVWQAFRPKKLGIIPAPLVAVVLATLSANLFALPIEYITVPSNILDSLTWPPAVLSKPELWSNLSVWGTVLAIALVASAESLLCATAVDQLHDGPRTHYDKELRAQGIGNAVCGLLGVLPITGVIVRSSANVQAGGLTNRSAILHGLWLLLFVVALPFVLSWIPISCLAALLVFTGYKLMNFQIIPKLAQHGKAEVGIFAFTVLTIVVADLLTGILVGVVLAMIKSLVSISQLDIVREEHPDGRIELHLIGSAVFIRLPRLACALESLPSDRKVYIHLEQLHYIDHACLELLMTWEKQHQNQGGELLMDSSLLKARCKATPPAMSKEDMKDISPSAR